MKVIAVSQRVAIGQHGERRDALDQRWISFFEQCGLLPLPVPNRRATAEGILREMRPDGILLTGGDNLVSYGGGCPERDETEIFLMEQSLKRLLPLIGVCRGMQLIQHYFGVKLQAVEGHIQPKQMITLDGRDSVVNSYHGLGTRDSVECLRVWGRASDGIVKAVRSIDAPIVGIMWHPERLFPVSSRDIHLFRNHFGAA